MGRQGCRDAHPSRAAAGAGPESVDDNPPGRRYRRGVSATGRGMANSRQSSIARLAWRDGVLGRLTERQAEAVAAGFCRRGGDRDPPALRRLDEEIAWPPGL